MQKQGSTMLKVVSIIMIVFAALGLLTDLFLIVGLSEEGLWRMADRYGYGMSTFNIALICLVAATVFELIAGIVGCANWYKKEKAGTCIGLGWIIIGLIALGTILEIVFFGNLSNYYSRGTFEGMSVGLAILGLVAMIVPILYLVGAYKLKNMVFQPVDYNSYYNNYGGQGYNNYTGQGYSSQNYTGQNYTNQNYTGQGYTNQGYTGQGYTNQGYTGQQNYTGQQYGNYNNQGYTGQQNYTGQQYSNYNNQGYTGQSYTGQDSQNQTGSDNQ